MKVPVVYHIDYWGIYVIDGYACIVGQTFDGSPKKSSAIRSIDLVNLVVTTDSGNIYVLGEIDSYSGAFWEETLEKLRSGFPNGSDGIIEVSG